MPTLMQTVRDMNSTNVEVKTKSELLIEAASSKHSSKFVLASVDLTKVPLCATGDDQGPLVIDINASGLRKTKSGFTPRIIIMSGADKIRAAKKNGAVTCSAWVGTKIIGHKKISILAGEVDPKSLLDKAMLQESLLDRPNNGPTQGEVPATVPTVGGFDVRNYGAPGSELNNPALRLMLNVEEALSMYRTETAKGIHKVTYTPYTPLPMNLVNAGREARIAAMSAGLDLEKFSIMDFLRWQDKKCTMRAAEQYKLVGTRELTASEFAYVGDHHDTSTWHCPLDTIAAASESLTALRNNRSVPKEDKDDVRDTLYNTIEAAGGPHLGKGKSAKKHIDEIRTKRAGKVAAGGQGSGRRNDGGIDSILKEKADEAKQKILDPKNKKGSLLGKKAN